MVRPQDTKDIPTTSYAILGLLTFGEMSGYDLNRLADQSIRYFFWSPARSQVYGELRRLASLGYATEREVQQETRPHKRLYQITAEGERALRAWLERPALEPDVRKSTFLLRVFFGSRTPLSTLIAQLEERQRQAHETLSQFQAIEQRIKDSDRFFFPYLTLKSGMAHVRAVLQWTEEALEELKERESRQAPDR